MNPILSDEARSGAPGSPPRGSAAQTPALFRRYPELATRIPWLPIGDFPTPIHPLDLGPATQGAQVWIKRDDLSGRPYGGNKVRKLEFILADAKSRGIERLITIGAVGSHHALATALYGRAHGFRVALVLFPQPMNDHVRRILLLDHALGAELRFTSRMETVPGAMLSARLAHRGQRYCVIAPGGSDPVGTLGYVSAGLELAEQIADGQAPMPDVVHVAAGTLGTAAGLAIGFALAGLDVRISAVRITGRLVANERALARLVSRTLARLRKAGLASAPRRADVLRLITMRHEFLGDGYGHETPAGREAAALFNDAGLSLDPTYTAKAAAGMLASVRAQRGGVHLFWHTLSAHEPVELLEGASAEALPEPFRRLLASA